MLCDHYIIRILNSFCDKLALSIFPPRVPILATFLNWLAFGVGYSTGTIQLARFVIQDYMAENSYEISDSGKDKLRLTVITIKKLHYNKNQGGGKNPMMFKDLQRIIRSIPEDYFERDLCVSLFLLAFNTCQRNSSCISIKFSEIYVVEKSGCIDSINITFNSIKGKGKDANRLKVIQTAETPECCFITEFSKYLKSKHGINIKEFNKIRNLPEWEDKKVWNIKRQTFRDYVEGSSRRAGYGKNYFSPHSFRSGKVCQMLVDALSKNTNSFKAVFEQSRVLGGWVLKSEAFKRYIKKSAFGALVSTSFVDPRNTDTYVDKNLLKSINFHNLKLQNEFKPNFEYRWKKLNKLLQDRIFEIFSRILGKPIEHLSEHILRFYDHTFKIYIFNEYCKIYKSLSYKKWETEHGDTRQVYIFENTRDKIIKPELENNKCEDYLPQLYKIIDSIVNSNIEAWSLDEDFELIRQIILNQNIKVSGKNILLCIQRYNHLKQMYNLDDIELLNHFDEQLKRFDENAPNNDFKSRSGMRYSNSELAFIKKCHDFGMKAEEMVTKMGLKGRSLGSVKTKINELKKEWLNSKEVVNILIPKDGDNNSRKGKEWELYEIEELRRQRVSLGMKIEDIIIKGRPTNGIRDKLKSLGIRISEPKQVILKNIEIIDGKKDLVKFVNNSTKYKCKYVTVYPVSKYETNLDFRKIRAKLQLHYSICDNFIECNASLDDKRIVFTFDENFLKLIHIVKNEIKTIEFTQHKFMFEEKIVIIKRDVRNADSIIYLIIDTDGKLIKILKKLYGNCFGNKEKSDSSNFVEKDMESVRSTVNIIQRTRGKIDNNIISIFLHQIRRLINYFVTENDSVSMKQVGQYLYEAKLAFEDSDKFKNYLVLSETPILSELSIEQLRKIEKLSFLFELNESDAWTLTLEEAEFNSAFYSKDNTDTVKSSRFLQSLETLNLSDLYIYDSIEGLNKKSTTSEWAIRVYELYMDLENEQREHKCLELAPLFPISPSGLERFVTYLSEFYACNTIRVIVTNVNKVQIENGEEKFTIEHWNSFKKAMSYASEQRNNRCKIDKRRMEGLGKAPCFYPVLFHILNLVPDDYPEREFYISFFLFMIYTGQRYITLSNVKLSDISRITTSVNKKPIVTIIARITKANNAYNQPFNLEGAFDDSSIMNFNYWLNKTLIKYHHLNLQENVSWENSKLIDKYLWGNKSSNFKEKILYSTVYLKNRLFYENAGIPAKLLGVHSFRSGFYCQSYLNSFERNISTTVLNELTMLIAGWKALKDQNVYSKVEMENLITSNGPIKDPTPEQMLGYNGVFENKWKTSCD